MESRHSVQSTSVSYGGIGEIQKDVPNSRITQKVLDIMNRPLHDVGMMDCFAHTGARGRPYISRVRSSHIECDRYRRFRLVQVGDIIYKGSVMACVDES